MIFQDPFSSLNPRMTIAEIIGEPLLVNGMTDTRARNARVAELLELVHLPQRLSEPLPARVLRRPAPAHRHRARAGADPVADRRGRAGVRAGRFGAGADRQPDAGAAGPARPRVSVRRARPVGGEACQPPRRGDVCRHASSRSRRPRRCSPRRAIPTPRRCCPRCRCPIPRRRAQRIVLEGDVADPSNPPPGCAFPSALPLRDRAVPAGRAGAGGSRAGPRGALPARGGPITDRGDSTGLMAPQQACMEHPASITQTEPIVRTGAIIAVPVVRCRLCHRPRHRRAGLGRASAPRQPRPADGNAAQGRGV